MLTKKQKEEFKIDNEGKEINSIDDLVLVRVTNYIPKGGIIHTPKDAGAKVQKEYNGVKYELPIQRDTLHFTVNGDLSGQLHEGGNWKNQKYAIIIPLNLVSKDSVAGVALGDVYFKGNLAIPKGAYILCPEEERESMKNEVGDSINVIGVEGEYIDGYPSILLQELGYKNKKITRKHMDRCNVS